MLNQTGEKGPSCKQARSKYVIYSTLDRNKVQDVDHKQGRMLHVCLYVMMTRNVPGRCPWIKFFNAKGNLSKCMKPNETKTVALPVSRRVQNCIIYRY